MESTQARKHLECPDQRSDQDRIRAIIDTAGKDMLTTREPMDMDIRCARKDDKGDIAELMYSAGKELYDFIYATGKASATDYIRFEYESGRGFCGHRNVTVAVQDDMVVATGCFYDGLDYTTLFAGSLANMLQFYGPVKVLPALRRAKHIGSVMAKPARDELYLSNFGVSPALRGQGIGSALINTQLAIARKKGYRVFSLDVADTNPKAEALYTRHGLSVVSVKTFTGKREGIVVPQSKKMELVL